MSGSIWEFIGLMLMTLGVWLWFDSLRARDAGIAAARRACESEGLQLLDDTVCLKNLRPSRNGEGRLLLQRAYEFEYSDTGDNRRRGGVILLGQRVVLINVGLRAVPPHATLP